MIPGTREHHQIRPGLAPALHHALQGLGPEQRGIAVQDQQVAVESLQRVPALEHRVPGAELRLLAREAGPAREGRLDRLGVAAHHHQALGLELLGRHQHVVEQRAAAQGVQNLRQPGFHARALAGGEHDHGDRRGAGRHELSSSAPTPAELTADAGGMVEKSPRGRSRHLPR
jgi:hypothetical protein